MGSGSSRQGKRLPGAMQPYVDTAIQSEPLVCNLDYVSEKICVCGSFILDIE